MEQGQHGVLTLYPTWLFLVDKLTPRLYTVLPKSTWHLTAFQRNSQEYLASSCSFYLCPNNKLAHAACQRLSPVRPDKVLFVFLSVFVCANVCVCVCVVVHPLNRLSLTL